MSCPRCGSSNRRHACDFNVAQQEKLAHAQRARLDKAERLREDFHVVEEPGESMESAVQTACDRRG